MTNETEPPDEAISEACEAAKRSPCAKSKRGVVAYRGFTTGTTRATDIVGVGFNGPPEPYTCANPCRPDDCRKLCQHAELRALFDAADYLKGGTLYTTTYPVELVHVKIDALGFVQPGGPPSCWQCSRAILDVGAAGIWLYEGTRTETRQPDGDAVLSYQLPAAWVYYAAWRFHEVTAHNCGLQLTATPTLPRSGSYPL